MKRFNLTLVKAISACMALMLTFCTFTACNEKKDLSVTVNGAENGVVTAVYNGSPVTVSVSGTDVTMKYVYEGTDGTVYTATEDAPVNAGSYNVTISFEGNNQYNEYSATVKLVVNKATNTFDLDMDDYVYGETATTPVVSGNKGGDLTYVYCGTGNTEYEESATAPTDAGAYKVKATAEATENYLEGNAEATFTIARATNEFKITMNDYVVGQTDVNPIVTENVSGGKVSYVYEGTGNTVYAKSENKPTEAGTYIVTATVEETKNYNSATSNDSFSVIKPARTDVPENKPSLNTAVMVLDDSFSIIAEEDTEYCLTDETGKQVTEYQTSPDFGGLNADTTYFVQARRPENDSAAASLPGEQKLEVKTLAYALLDDFERKGEGEGVGNFAVSKEKAYKGEKALVSGSPDGAYGFILQPNSLVERDDNGNKFNGYWQNGDFDSNYIDISGYRYISFYAFFDKDVAIGQGIEIWKEVGGNVFNCGVGQTVNGGSWQRVIIDMTVNGVVNGNFDDICSHVAKIYFNFAWTPASEIGTFYIDNLALLK